MPNLLFKKILKKNNVTDSEQLYIDDIVLNLNDLWVVRNGKDEKKMNAFVCAVFSILFETLDKEGQDGK